MDQTGSSSGVSKPYLIQNQIGSLLLCSHLSDVVFSFRFQFGNPQVCAHKFPLTMASEVFEKMFYGPLKMDTTKPIEIIDISINGFQNMLRYIYTSQLDFKFEELYETYLAGDKYIIHHWNDAISEYIKLKLNESNSCLIYDQLLKIEDKSSLPFEQVEEMVVNNVQKIFESEYFTKLNENTLISLLKLDKLCISEIDLLKFFYKWITANSDHSQFNSIKRIKRRRFRIFKDLIRFEDLNPQDVADFYELSDLITDEEIGSLLIHLLNPRRSFSIKYLGQRKTGSQIHSIFSNCGYRISFLQTVLTLFSVNRRVHIQTIHTSISTLCANVDLIILDDQDADLNLEIEKLVINQNWSFAIKSSFKVQQDAIYTLKFQHKEEIRQFSMSNKKKLEFEFNKKYFIFNLDYSHYGFAYHFVKKIDFYSP